MKENRFEKLFLNERFMGFVCAFMALAGLVSLAFCVKERDAFESFALLVKLATATAAFLAFRSLKWDAAKGLLGGVLFCLMYQEAQLALGFSGRKGILTSIWWLECREASSWRGRA